MTEKRRKIWIDHLQTRLSVRIVLYFLSYQLLVWLVALLARNLLIEFENVLGESAAVYCFSFLVISVVLFGCQFIYDAVRFSHRVVGPLYRFRQTVKAVAAGEDVELIRLREGDYLLELKDEFNAMLKALEQRGAVVLKGTETGQQDKQIVPVLSIANGP